MYNKQVKLVTLQAGILPSSEAVCSLPNTLVAICLNNAGLERVQSTKALACIVQIFTSKTYTKALQGDTPPALGAGLDELLRHVSSLRKEGVDMMISILRRLCEMGGESADELMASAAVVRRHYVDYYVCCTRLAAGLHDVVRCQKTCCPKPYAYMPAAPVNAEQRPSIKHTTVTRHLCPRLLHLL